MSPGRCGLDRLVEGVQRDLEVTPGGLGRELGPEQLGDLVALQPAAAMGHKQLEELAGLVALPLARLDLRVAAPDSKCAQRLHAQLVAGVHVDVGKPRPASTAGDTRRGRQRRLRASISMGTRRRGSGGPSRVGAANRNS